jgi:hypothetical protein
VFFFLELPELNLDDETDSDDEDFNEESLIRYYFKRGPIIIDHSRV